MGVLKKTEWSEEKVQNILKQYFFAPNSKKYEITNLYVYGWESDYLAITRSMIAHEVEIKITRADFKNDFKNKKDKHLLLERLNGGNVTLGKFCENSPNYFYYAVPNGIIHPEEVPEYAGLIYVKPYGIEIIKDAKKLTDEKFDIEKLEITDKFYYNMEAWRLKYLSVINAADEIKRYKQMEKSYVKDVNMYERMLEEKDAEIDNLEYEIKKLKNELGKT